MTAQKYDLVVIGAGSAGVRLARVSASLGAKVAIVEKGAYGGTCVNLGCVPKKLMMFAASYADHFKDAEGFGWHAKDTTFSWDRFLARKNAEIHRLNLAYEALLKSAGVTLMHGHARLIDAHTVKVAEQYISGQAVVIATGGHPAVPNIEGNAHAITSDAAFYLPELPRRIAIIGGGYVAVEFASIFNGLGSEVDLVIRGDCLLGGFDHELRENLAAELVTRGIGIRFHSEVVNIQPQGTELKLALTSGKTLDRDVVMFATGRRPRTENLGLEQVGVRLGASGEIIVDAWGQSSVNSIYAIGDVTGGLALTPVAIREGLQLAHTLFGERPTPLDRTLVPTAVFGLPAVSAVGLTEEQARARNLACLIYRSRFRALKHTISGREERTFIKLVVDRDNNRVLGCHMLGPDAPEVIQGLAVALQAGVTKAQFDATVGIHPTVAEEFVTMLQPA